MGAVRLGRNYVRWCSGCNIPILEERACPLCGGTTREVTLTPPGDVRPAFDHDITLIRDAIDSQFGTGTGELLLPDDKVILLNKVPALDRMDEIIVDGQVVGALRYDIGRGWTFIVRMYGAVSIAPVMSR
jgi:phosphoadenosine phosphosulfate reductase